MIEPIDVIINTDTSGSAALDHGIHHANPQPASALRGSVTLTVAISGLPVAISGGATAPPRPPPTQA